MEFMPVITALLLVTTIVSADLGSIIDNANESRILSTTMAPMTSSLDGGYIHEAPSTNNEDSTVTTPALSTSTDTFTQTKMYNSQEMEKIAEEMKKDMNLSVNPCDNFYEFTCGNFMGTEETRKYWLLKSNDPFLSYEPTYLDQFDVTIEDITEELRTIMVESIDAAKDPKYVQNLKIAHLICMNKTQLGSRECVKTVCNQMTLAIEVLFAKHFLQNFQKIDANHFDELLNYLVPPLLDAYTKAGFMNNDDLKNELENKKLRLSRGLYRYCNESLIEDATTLIHHFNFADVQKNVEDLYQTIKKHRTFEKQLSSLFEFISLGTSIENDDAKTEVIHVPLRMMQGVFFHPNGPQYLNYGALGSLVAHYVSLKFKNIASNYFKVTGSTEDDQKISSLYGCINGGLYAHVINVLNQTIQSPIEPTIIQPKIIEALRSMFMQPIQTTVYGYKMAYLGYKKWIEDNKAEPQLTISGKSYTPEQLFWINAARARCVAVTSSAVSLISKYVVKSSREYEINQYFLHLEEFEEAFHCSTNESFKLNPKNRVCPVP